MAAFGLDGLTISLFVADNGRIEYMVSAKSVVVSEGNKVLREEPMVDFHGPEAPAEQGGGE